MWAIFKSECCISKLHSPFGYMTRLGEFLARKAINKAHLGRQTKLSRQRISELCLNQSAKLTGFELYKISRAMEIEISVLAEILYGGLVED